MTTEQFHHTTKAGAEIVLPRFKNLPAGLIRKLRDENELGFIFGLLEALLDEKAIEAVDGMDMLELREFGTAWQTDSKVTAGESSASSTS